MTVRGGKRPNAGRKAPTGIRINHTIKFSDTEWSLVRQYARESGFKDTSEYIRSTAQKNDIRKIPWSQQ